MQSYIIFFNKRIKVPQVSCLLNSRQADERYELTRKLTFLIILFYIMMITTNLTTMFMLLRFMRSSSKYRVTIYKCTSFLPQNDYMPINARQKNHKK